MALPAADQERMSMQLQLYTAERCMTEMLMAMAAILFGDTGKVLIPEESAKQMAAAAEGMLTQVMESLLNKNKVGFWCCGFGIAFVIVLEELPVTNSDIVKLMEAKPEDVE